MSLSRRVWAIVVPVKRLETAKTRLLLPDPLRRRLALAMALDTVRAALATDGVAGVVVVTDDGTAGPELRAAGAHIEPDLPDAGLNPALVHGAAAALALHPDAGVVAMSSDLPALRPAELAALLTSLDDDGSAVVADAAGDGTTLLAAARLSGFRPAFGPGSRAAHTAGGAVDATARAGASLRHDVDSRADLATAALLGCGPATAALLAAHADLVPPAQPAQPAPGSAAQAGPGG